MKHLLSKKDYSLLPYFFEKDEIQKIVEKVQNLKIKYVVYCSFENRFAKCGGLAAVTLKMIPALKRACKNTKVLLLTPFYPYFPNADKLQSTGLSFELSFAKKIIFVEILEYKVKDPDTSITTQEYYLKADGFFNARNKQNDPYVYSSNNSRNNNAIRENALFFSKAVPLAMKALKIRKNIMFHLQEWQTVLTALTVKEAMVEGVLESCATIQTMHNPFDNFIPWNQLSKIIDNKRIQKIKSHFKLSGMTAYQIGLQLVDGPITNR